MEYVVGGDLGSLLQVLGQFSESMTLVYSGEAVVALDYLHQNEIVHRQELY
jgi:serine/threonine protein kinase